jgi:hypothetical protein
MGNYKVEIKATEEPVDQSYSFIGGGAPAKPASRMRIGGAEKRIDCPMHGSQSLFAFGTGDWEREWCAKCFGEAITSVVSKRLWEHAQEEE